MAVLKHNEVFQILYDYRLFLHNSLLYNYNQEILDDFAEYMDNIYYPNSRAYYKVIRKFPEWFNGISAEILFFNHSFNNLNIDVNENHLKDINNYINKYYDDNNIIRLTDSDIIAFDQAIYDCTIWARNSLYFLNVKLYISKLRNFAEYMDYHYPDIPYFEVVDMVAKIPDDRVNRMLCDDCQFLFLEKNKLTNAHYSKIMKWIFNGSVQEKDWIRTGEKRRVFRKK